MDFRFEFSLNLRFYSGTLYYAQVLLFCKRGFSKIILDLGPVRIRSRDLFLYLLFFCLFFYVTDDPILETVDFSTKKGVIEGIFQDIWLVRTNL